MYVHDVEITKIGIVMRAVIDRFPYQAYTRVTYRYVVNRKILNFKFSNQPRTQLIRTYLVIDHIRTGTRIKI